MDQINIKTPNPSHWFTPPPTPRVNKYRGVCIYTVCNRGGSGCVETSGVMHCVFDQIPNLQNCFTTPNKNLGGEGASDR
jgi:hypothetical protein